MFPYTASPLLGSFMRSKCTGLFLIMLSLSQKCPYIECPYIKTALLQRLAFVQGPGDFGTQAAIGLLQALIPALLMNICIVGMNQIFDVDIDKINKPYLPLASGVWSLNTGISVAVSTGLVAVLLALYIGSAPLLATVVGSLLLGIAYSVDLPFLRWKRYPVLAMGCILSVRYAYNTLLLFGFNSFQQEKAMPFGVMA